MTCLNRYRGESLLPPVSRRGAKRKDPNRRERLESVPKTWTGREMLVTRVPVSSRFMMYFMTLL